MSYWTRNMTWNGSTWRGLEDEVDERRGDNEPPHWPPHEPAAVQCGVSWKGSPENRPRSGRIFCSEGVEALPYARHDGPYHTFVKEQE